jgi:hypothetical protein
MAFAAKTWYIGWLGEMRALLTPEVDFSNTEERYGGIHQSLNGARTVDVTGVRSAFDMSWNYMTDTELSWLYALYDRMIAQPNYLINPMKKNLISKQASVGYAHGIDDNGIYFSSTALREWRNDYPTGLPITGSRVPLLSSVSGSGAFSRIDGDNKWIPVTAGEPITFSIYMKADAPITMNMVADWADKYHTQTGVGTFFGKNITTSWARYSITVTPNSTQFGLRPAMTFPTGLNNIRFAAPQVEYGSVATDWELGGGCMKVSIDQMNSSSPRFPLNNVSATILEV